MFGREILAAVTLVFVGGVGSASGISSAAFVQLFEEARQTLPCAERIKDVAERYSLRKTNDGTHSDTYTETEFSNLSGSMFLLFSEETQGNEITYAVSLSTYKSGKDLPADITLAYMDIWDLPAPTPLRQDPSVASFSWGIDFPNGANVIVISYSDASDMTQIYGRLAPINKDLDNGCSN